MSTTGHDAAEEPPSVSPFFGHFPFPKLHLFEHNNCTWLRCCSPDLANFLAFPCSASLNAVPTLRWFFVHLTIGTFMFSVLDTPKIHLTGYNYPITCPTEIEPITCIHVLSHSPLLSIRQEVLRLFKERSPISPQMSSIWSWRAGARTTYKPLIVQPVQISLLCCGRFVSIIVRTLLLSVLVFWGFWIGFFLDWCKT